MEDIHLEIGVADEHINFKVNEITENGQTHGRDYETMVRHVKSGTILEMACAKALEGEMNPNVFNKEIPQTFAWDVEAQGLMFEVKSSPKGDTWFNFNLHEVQNPSETQLTRVNLSTYLKYINYTDQ